MDKQEATPVGVPKEILVLPFSGRRIEVTSRRVKGADMISARCVAKDSPAADLIFTYALWSTVLKEGERQLVYEDLYDMDTVDLAIIRDRLRRRRRRRTRRARSTWD